MSGVAWIETLLYELGVELTPGNGYMLGKALARLSERENQIVILAYAEELTIDEVADVLRIEPAIASRLHQKALARIREQLGGS